jgi:hypothetical protein
MVNMMVTESINSLQILKKRTLLVFTMKDTFRMGIIQVLEFSSKEVKFQLSKLTEYIKMKEYLNI